MFMREDLAHDSQHPVLSPRQLEILRYMWEGLPSNIIGEKNGLKP